MPFVFGSTGIPGRIGTVHIDVIEDIRAPRSFDRTNVALERGAPTTNHRQRVPYQIVVTVVISDVEPIAGLLLTPLWELNHAARTRDALRLIQELGTEVVFFDGREIWRTPGGTRVWTIDNIDEGKNVETNGGLGPQSWRAVITLGEVPRFATLFTVVPPTTAPVVQDAADGIVDAGQQSTEAIPLDLASTIPG